MNPKKELLWSLRICRSHHEIGALLPGSDLWGVLDPEDGTNPDSIDGPGGLSVWCLVGNWGMDYGDSYWGLYKGYYRDPFPHSLLSIRE